MKRRTFIRHTALVSAGTLLGGRIAASPAAPYPNVRTPSSQRKFSSQAVEKAIAAFREKAGNRELAWLFENCFPNTLDTTVDFSMQDGRPDTYIITGDIDAMWQRDSTAQVWPYLPFMKDDQPLQQLIAGTIRRQAKNIITDPYANAFYKDPSKTGEWKNDITAMKPGIHERKWEIDSLCYPVRLGYRYWKLTGDTSPFDAQWKQAANLILTTFRQQQRWNGKGPYKFERTTSWATDGVPLGGYGYPVKPCGLICSMFRPSDDATIFPFLIPSNFFAATILKQLANMLQNIHHDSTMANEALALSNEIEQALAQHAIVTHASFGKVYAYEVNGFGSFNLMDDANVPSLLSLPYLGAVKNTDPIYINTRKLLLSGSNPFFFKGKAGEGIGGPHAGTDMIWPLSIIMRALTSNSESEIRFCLGILQKSHAGTGFMHESFHKDDVNRYSRKWFAWANTLFGELLYKVMQQRPALLAQPTEIIPL